MAAIHRLVCTHCTFGTSELEPNTAENAAKVLGYSVRRSSLPEPDRGPLRTAFRAVERLLSYDVPKDTPPAKKESLEAATAPRRLVFVPGLGGWQAVAHVAYRARDTHGRIGSYFADVLAARVERDAQPWCPLDVLRLWATAHDDAPSADWWCISEEALADRDGDGRWKPADAARPADLAGGDEPFIDDALLEQFLTLEPGASPRDPGSIVPPRWWAMPARQRRDLLAALLNATIQSRKNNGKETVVIAVEPSLAALLFYGVFRLLPPKLRAGIGFSTYDVAPERALTPLVATTFLDREASTADLPPDLTARGFACNTFRDVAKFGRTPPLTDGGFVRHAVDLAVAPGGWTRLDGFLAALEAVPRLDCRDLDEFTRIDVFVTGYVTGGKKLDKLGPEPTVRPGSEAERYRSIRFRALLAEDLRERGIEWPRDLLRTAIAWLGEELPAAWDGGGPVAAALRSRLPDDDNGLAKMLAVVKDGRSTPWGMVADAVMFTALAADPPGLPPSFVDFVAKGSRRRADDSRLLVQLVLERLAARNRQDLLEAPDAALIEPILDAVEAWEKDQPGRWNALRIPLLPIITRELTTTCDTTKSRTEFIARHGDLAGILGKCARPQPFTDAIDDFFVGILRLSPKTAKALKPGEFLSAGGRSRAKDLERWVSFVKPENEHRYREMLVAWRDLHDVITQIKPLAEQAGMFSGQKPDPAVLVRFLKAYDTLRPVDAVDGTSASHRLGTFLTYSLDGLGVGQEPIRKKLLGWLDAALLERTRNHGAALAKVGGGSRSRSPSPALLAGIGGAVVAAAIGGIVLHQQQVGPSSGKTETAGPDAAPQPGSTSTEPERVVPAVPAKTAATTGSTAAMPTTPAPSPTPPPAPPKPLKDIDLGFAVDIKGGKLVASWNPKALEDATLQLTITAPVDGPPKGPQSVDPAVGRYECDLPKNGFGRYTVQLAAARRDPNDHAKKSEEVSLERPPTPTVDANTVHVEVTEAGPTLKFTAKPGRTLVAYGGCKYVLTMSGQMTQRLDVPAAQSHDVVFPIAALKPENVRSGTFSLGIETNVGSGESSEFTFKPPADFSQALCEKLATRTIEGIPGVYACPLNVEGAETTLLELPWFLNGADSSFDLRLLEPENLDEPRLSLKSAEGSKDSPKRWACKSGDFTIGHFEIYCPHDKPWTHTLRFKPSSEKTAREYERLQAHKLCFQRGTTPVATVQLVSPVRLGAMTISLPEIDLDRDAELPRLRASLEALPATLNLCKLSFCISDTDKPHEGGFLIRMAGKQNPFFTATFLVQHDKTEASVGLKFVPKTQVVTLENWRWIAAPGRKEGEEINLEQPRTRKRNAAKLDAEISTLEKQLVEKKDDQVATKAVEVKKEKRRLLDGPLAFDEQCEQFIQKLSSKRFSLDEWTVTWKVVADASIPADVPGTLAVFAVVGKKGTARDISFESKDKPREK